MLQTQQYIVMMITLYLLRKLKEERKANTYLQLTLEQHCGSTYTWIFFNKYYSIA